MCCAGLQDIGVQVNNSKEDIDRLSTQLEARQMAAPVGTRNSSTTGSTAGEGADNEQYLLMQQLKIAKARWVLACKRQGSNLRLAGST